MLQKMVRCTSLVSTLPEAALSPQHIRARTCLSRAGGGRALQLAMVSPTGHRMEAGDMVNPLGMCPGLGNRFPLSSWFSEQACGSWKRRDQIRPREKERKKERKKKIWKTRTFLEALKPLSLQPPEGRRRRETKQKAQENEPKQHYHEGFKVQSKQRRDAAGQDPSQKPVGFRRSRGSRSKRCPFMARRGGPWRGSLPY